MKRFTVPAIFGSKKSQFHLYIGDGITPTRHPLYYQQMWLREERGGEIPPEVIESFAKLAKIALEQNVSFEELCMYALGAASTTGQTGAKPQPPTSQTSVEMMQLNIQIQEEPENAALYLKRAKLLLSQRRVNEMLTDYETALRLDAKSADIYVSRGIYYLSVRNFQKAVDDFSAAIQLAPDQWELYKQRAEAYNGLRLKTAMFSDFDQLIQRAPTAAHYRRRAQIYVQYMRSRDAVTDYTQAIALDENNSELYIERSKVYQKIGNIPLAVEDLSHAIHLKPNEASYFAQRASIRMQQKQFKDALADYTHAIQRKADMADYFVGRARTLIALDNLTAARQDWDDAVQLQPTANNLEERGRLFKQLGEMAAASADFLRAAQWHIGRNINSLGLRDAIRLTTAALDCQPNNVDALVERSQASLLLSTSKPDDILKDCEQIILLQPNNVSAWRIRGLVYQQRLGQFVDAIAAFKEMLCIEEHNSEAYFLLGAVYALMGDYDNALKQLNHSLYLSPDQIEVLLKVCEIHLLLNQAEEALKASSNAVALNKSSVSALISQGLAYEKLGDDQRALESYSAAVGLRPRFEKPFILRAELLKRLGEMQSALADYISAHQINPKSIAALTGTTIAYISLGDPVKAEEYAKKILAIEPKNVFAQSIIQQNS